MELTQCLNYLLTTAQHKVFQEMSSRLEKFDVTPVQYGVMYCLWIEGKTKPKEIAAELKLENSTISGVLERMEKKELIGFCNAFPFSVNTTSINLRSSLLT